MNTITVFIYMGMLLIVQHEGIATAPDITSKQQHVPDSNSPIRISHLDHLVLTVTDMARTVEFYTRVLGMELITFNGGRQAVKFGKQKINLHELSKELEPKANKPTPGSADLCFITTTDLEQVSQHFKACKVDIVEGPVERTGAMGTMTSLYIRDPDGNLIEVSNYSTSDVHLK